MNVKIKEISELEYRNLHHQILFENEETDRCFGVISNGKFDYRFAWQSDMITPFMLINNDHICLLGIDQNFAIIDFDKGIFELNIILDYFFYDAIIFNSFIYVITELTILKIDLLTYAIIEKYSLPNYFEKIHFNDEGETKILCLNGETLVIKQLK